MHGAAKFSSKDSTHTQSPYKLGLTTVQSLRSSPVGNLLALVGIRWVLQHEQAATGVLGVQLLLPFLTRSLPDVLLLLHMLQQQRVLHAGCTRIEACSWPPHQPGVLFLVNTVHWHCAETGVGISGGASW